MDRRHFISLAGTGLIGLTMADTLAPLMAKTSKRADSYSVVILGDTHFDTEPATVYHSNYMEKVDWLNRVQRAEFARNGEMWRERCPRLMERASRLIGKDTRIALQLGDLIQGDCGKGEVHRKMLDDVLTSFKKQLGSLPFVTVVGNHDIRGTDAKRTYHEYMPQRMSEELKQPVLKTTFAFWIGKDVYIVLDFNDPDDAELDRILQESESARYTFVLTHGPLFPYDGKSCRWFFHGNEKDTEQRLRYRQLFARRNVICLCGHVHTTEFLDWQGDGGRITQLTVNSVWAKEKLSQYDIEAEGAEQYGVLRKNAKNDDGSPVKDETPLFDEYRPGIQAYTRSRAAGSYRMNVSNKGVTIEFYGGASEQVTTTFIMR